MSGLVRRSRLERLLARLIGARGTDVTVVFDECGHTMEAVVPDDALWSGVLFILLLRAYERASFRLDEIRGPVVDAGAHVGLFSLSAAAHGNEVVAVEAHPATFALLESNVAACKLPGIATINRAVAGIGDVDVAIEGRNSVSASISGHATGPHRVTTVTLDELVDRYGPLGLLKMNIEGAEFEALAAASDATLRRIASIVVECHGGDTDALAACLQQLGFDVTVEKPFFYSWREPVSRVLRNSRSVRGLVRLKIVAPLVFTAVALCRPFVNIAEAADADHLRYVFARRRD